MRQAVAATVAFFLCAALAYGLRPALERDAPGPPTAAVGEPKAPEEDSELASPTPKASPVADGPSLEALLERLPPIERAPARAPIRGRVLLDDDSPVAGARIEAWIAAPTVLGIRLEELVREWAEEERASTYGRISATTDAAGWFELRNLVHADYRLEAAHPDLWIVPANPQAETHRPGDQVDFLAGRGRPFELEVDVVGPGEGSPDEAMIAIRGTTGSDRAALWGDRQLEGSRWGRAFQWSPSRRRLTVGWSGELVAHGPRHSVSETVAVSPSAPQARVTLRLAEPNGILLEVRLPEGSEKVVSRAAVMRIDPAHPPTLERFARGAKWIGDTRMPYALSNVAMEGGVAPPLVTDIPRGAYQVGVTLSRSDRRMVAWSSGPSSPPRGGRVDGWTTVTVAEGLARARIEIAEPSLEGRILARVTGPEGELLDGVELTLWRSDGKAPSPRQERIDWDRRADGSYLVGPLSETAAAALAGTEGGTLELAAKHARLGEARGPVIPGVPPVADVSFRKPERLEVEIPVEAER